MSDPQELRAKIEEELERTSFQRKVVSHRDMADTMAHAIEFFTQHGYRSGRTGRPNQIFVRGGREGLLPRVNAEVLIQTNVGKGNVTMLSISGAGEQLSTVLGEYADLLRAEARAERQRRTRDE